MKNIWKSLLIVAIAFFGVALTAQAADLKLGVVAPRGIIKANEKWSALAEYIGTVLNKNVKLVPVTPDKVESSLE